MKRCAALALGTMLAGCAAAPPLPVLPAAAPVAAAVPVVPVVPGQCRVGPDGGIPVADRGIGGTGIRVADRGIGGTGAPATTGIVGVPTTGIVGVITGFASVCLAGEEVPYAPDVPVLVDGRPGRLDELRAGQVAAVGAAGARPVAQAVAVRHEVSGPLQRVEADGTLVVAEQRVVPTPGFVPERGAWLLVSGFRRGDGVILATRLDVGEPGRAVIRGVLRGEEGRLFLGDAEVRPAPYAALLPQGTPVVATGTWEGDVLTGTLEPDGLLVDPGAYFGGAGVLVVEGYAEGGFFPFGGGRYGAPFGRGFGVWRLRRAAGGRFEPVSAVPFEHGRFGPGLRPGFGAGLGGTRAAFSPAPMPNRGSEAGAAGARGLEPGLARGNGAGRGSFGPGGGFGGGGFGPGAGRGGPR